MIHTCIVIIIMKSWPSAVQFSRFGARKILQDRNVILLVFMIYSKHTYSIFIGGGSFTHGLPPMHIFGGCPPRNRRT